MENLITSFSTCLNNIENDSIFSTFYNLGKLLSSLFWSNSSLTSGLSGSSQPKIGWESESD